MDSAQPAQTNGGSAVQPAHAATIHAADSCPRWSTLLTDVQRAIALWLPSLRDIAFVNSSWNASALWSIESAQNEFWNSTFDVEWLVVATGKSLLLHPEVRLQRLVGKNVTDPRSAADPTIRWWYNVQLHLGAFCQKYIRRHGTAPTPRVIFDLCYSQSVCKRRCCRELFPELFEVNLIIHSLVETEVDAALFNKVSFATSRDLGCDTLGMTTKEVLGTLLCMTQHEYYCCWSRLTANVAGCVCGCRTRKTQTNGDSAGKTQLAHTNGDSAVQPILPRSLDSLDCPD